MTSDSPKKPTRKATTKKKGEEKPPKNPNWRDTWVPHPDILGGGALLRPVRYPHNKDFRPNHLLTGDVTPDEMFEILKQPNGKALLKERMLEDAERRRQRRKKAPKE